MPIKPIQLVALSPAPDDLARLIKKFCKTPGYLTSFDDARLSVARDLGVDEDFVECIPFGELMGRACSEVGLRPLGIATRGQLRAATEFACAELPADSPYYACRDFPGFHETLMESLRELHHHGVNADDLERVALAAESPLKERLLALREIEVGTREGLLKINRGFSSDRAQLFVESEVTRAPHISQLLVLAGAEVRPVELLALKKFAELGVDVTVVVEHSSVAFEGAKKIAKNLGISYPKAVGKSGWTEALFVGVLAEQGPEATIFSAADPLAECEWALRQCQAAFSGGVLEHRITLFAADPQTYVPLLMASARRLDIRLDARVMTPLLTNGFAHLVRTILEVLSHTGTKGVERLAGSTYFGTSLEQRRTIRDFLHAPHPAPWDALAEFADLNRDEFPWLWPVVSWRSRAMAARRTLPEWHEMFEELLRLDVLEKAAQDMESHKREHDRRAQTAMLRALVDYAPAFDARESHSLDLNSFYECASRLWDLEQIFLPSAGRGFRVVSNPVEIGDADMVVALGMLEGAIPKRRTENAILNDEDRAYLAASLPDHVALPTSFEEASAQRDQFIRLCAAAKKRLVFGYPQTDDERENVRTSYLEEVVTALGDVDRRDYKRKELVPSEDECRLQADLDLRMALDRPAPPFEIPSLQAAEARSLIRPEFEGSGVAVTEVSAALRCPFQSAAGHRLGLRPDGLRLENRLRRLPVSAGLNRAKTAEEAEEALVAELKVISDQESGRAEAWESTLLEAGATRYIRGWVTREFRARQLWPRTSDETTCRVKFGDPELRDTLKVDDRVIRLVGEVDGITQIGPYQVVQLYRSGAAEMPSLQRANAREDRWMELALYMAGAMQAKRPLALEYDSTNGARTLIVMNRQKEQDGLLMHKDDGLFITNMDLPVAAFRDQLIALLRRALLALELADMRPTPGEHCRQCDFGELCRVSSELVEMSDLFSPEGTDV